MNKIKRIDEEDEEDEEYEYSEDGEALVDEQEFGIQPSKCSECISDFEYEGVKYVLDFFVENDINYCTYCGAVLNV